MPAISFDTMQKLFPKEKQQQIINSVFGPKPEPETPLQQADAERSSSYQDMMKNARLRLEEQRTKDVQMAKYNALGNALMTMVQPIGWAIGGGGSGATGGVQQYDNRQYLDAFNRAVKASDDLRNLGMMEDQFRYKTAEERYQQELARANAEAQRKANMEDYQKKAEIDAKIRDEYAEAQYQRNLGLIEARGEKQMDLARFKAEHNVTNRGGVPIEDKMLSSAWTAYMHYKDKYDTDTGRGLERKDKLQSFEEWVGKQYGWKISKSGGDAGSSNSGSSSSSASSGSSSSKPGGFQTSSSSSTSSSASSAQSAGSKPGGFVSAGNAYGIVAGAESTIPNEDEVPGEPEVKKEAESANEKTAEGAAPAYSIETRISNAVSGSQDPAVQKRLSELTAAKEYAEKYFTSEGYRQRAQKSGLSGDNPINGNTFLVPSLDTRLKDSVRRNVSGATIIGLKDKSFEGEGGSGYFDTYGVTLHEIGHGNRDYAPRVKENVRKVPLYGHEGQAMGYEVHRDKEFSYPNAPEESVKILTKFNKNVKEDGHDNTAHEAYSDLVMLRGMLERDGIFKSTEGGGVFTKKMLKEFKRLHKGALPRYLTNHNDDAVIEAINKVALNDPALESEIEGLTDMRGEMFTSV